MTPSQEATNPTPTPEVDSAGKPAPSSNHVLYKGKWHTKGAADRYAAMSQAGKEGKLFGGKQMTFGSDHSVRPLTPSKTPTETKTPPAVPDRKPKTTSGSTPSVGSDAVVKKFRNWKFTDGLPDLFKGGFFQKFEVKK